MSIEIRAAEITRPSREEQGAGTLVELLVDRAQNRPEFESFIFIDYPGSGSPREDKLTCGAVFAQARAVAATLLQSLTRGDRVLIVCPPGPDYIVSFYGCLMAGVIAVPVYPPSNAKQMAGLEAIMADASGACILVPDAMRDQMMAWSGDSETLPMLIAVDRIDHAAGVHWINPKVKKVDIAYLQYTSGSTGLPKGVMISHDNLMDNAKRIAAVSGVTGNSIAINWVPPHHDMGLMCGVVGPIFAGMRGILMSPTSFLQRPVRWLEAIGRYGATHTSAPNFGYQLVADTASEEDISGLDLSSLQTAASGGEPVRVSTLRKFADRFEPAGFCFDRFKQVLGMAETVLVVTGSKTQSGPRITLVDGQSIPDGKLVSVDVDSPEHANGHVNDGTKIAELISCGPVIDEHELLIVDPQTRTVCADGTIGEIWFAGPSVAGGYWNRPEATKATFGATLAGETDGRCFLRSGDLGALLDGELYVCGRHKDMVIVHGQNHHAHDLERTATEALDWLDPDRTIALGIETQGREQLLMLHELDWSTASDIDVHEAVGAIRHNIVVAHEIDAVGIVFVRPGSLPRTTSGKLRRTVAKQRYFEGELPVLADWNQVSGLVSLHDHIMLTRFQTQAGPCPQATVINAHLELVDGAAKVYSLYRLLRDGSLRLDIHIVANEHNTADQLLDDNIAGITKHIKGLPESINVHMLPEREEPYISSCLFGGLDTANNRHVQRPEDDIDRGYAVRSVDHLLTDLKALHSMPPSEREALLVDYLQKELQSILELSDLPNPDMSFFAQGIDSLMFVELDQRIETVFQINLPTQAIFDNPTIGALASYISLRFVGDAEDLPSVNAPNRSIINEIGSYSSAADCEDMAPGVSLHPPHDQKWLKQIIRNSLNANHKHKEYNERLIDEFLTKNHFFTESFLARISECDNARDYKRLEESRFLKARRSTPLDPATPVTGGLIAVAQRLGEEELCDLCAKSIFALVSMWIDERQNSTDPMRDLLGVTRVFGNKSDSLLSYKFSEFAVLLYRSRVFLLRVVEEGTALPIDVLYNSIRQIVTAADNIQPTSLAALTTLEKDEWVALTTDVPPCVSQALAEVESTLFTISVNPSQTDSNGTIDKIAGLTGTGTNRWFGKTNLVVEQDGNIGMYIDHAILDGRAQAIVFDSLMKRFAQLDNVPKRDRQIAGRWKSIGKFPPQFEQEWLETNKKFCKLASRLSASEAAVTFVEVPDHSVIPIIILASQYVFYMETGRLEAPYVPVSRRHIAHLSLEFVHETAPGTPELMQQLTDVNCVDMDLLDNVLGWWQSTYTAAMEGQLGRRAMHYLYDHACNNGVEQHPLFAAAGYPQRLEYPPLCLSIVGGDKTMPALVFPPCDGGWGIGATPHGDGINLAVTAWETDTVVIAGKIRDTIKRILALCAN